MPQEEITICSPAAPKPLDDVLIQPIIDTTLTSTNVKFTTSNQSSDDDTELLPEKRWSLSSGEMELQRATASLRTWTTEMDCWNIPDSDSDDELGLQYQKQCPVGQTKSYPYPPPPAFSKNELRFSRFNMPSDSEDEDPYSMAKSPRSSILPAAPPVPPPVSTIPRNDSTARLLPVTPSVTAILPAPSTTAQLAPSFSLQSPVVAQPSNPFPKPSLDPLAFPVMYRTRSLPLSPTSPSDTDPYDDIEIDATGAKSQPRYNFKLKKSKEVPVKLLISPSKEYAEITKLATWNFPSSDEEDDSSSPNTTKAAASGDDSRRSSTSSEGDRPMVPPKLWEIEAQRDDIRRCSSDSGVRGSNREKGAAANEIVPDVRSGSETSVTIEYHLIEAESSSRNGSLLGADDRLPFPSPTHSQSSEFDDDQEFLETASIMSDGSSKLQADYEQSSACVDIDQLSLDSSDNRPRRIVETHETHEIVSSENNEDDIIERIIETQTITEKLDEGTNFKAFSPVDFSKYLENDDEFVSHIFTLGRTHEKGNSKRHKDKKDFAFLNPFGTSEAVTETIPIEKKIVKQKITTLVKKKRNADEENIYDEVVPGGLNMTANDTKLLSGTEHERLSPKPPPRTVTNGESSNTLHASGEIQFDCSDDDGKAKSKDGLKGEKRFKFKGLKKFWRRKEKMEQIKGLPLELEDDYQEFVP